MANSCSLSHQRTWKWTSPFLHFLDITVLNSHIILSSCGSRVDHGEFHLALFQHLLEMSAWEPHSQSTPRGRPHSQAIQMRHSKPDTCALANHRIALLVSCVHSQEKTKFQCSKCKIGLCIVPCCRIFCTEVISK